MCSGFLHLLLLLPSCPYSSRLWWSCLWSQASFVFLDAGFRSTFPLQKSSFLNSWFWFTFHCWLSSSRIHTTLPRNPSFWIHLNNLELRNGSAKGAIQGKIWCHRWVSSFYSNRRQTESASSGEERPSSFRSLALLKRNSTWWSNVPDPGWVQNARREEEEEQAVDQRVLGPGKTSQLRLWASSRPVLEVSAHRVLSLTNYFQPSLTRPRLPSLCLLWVPIDPAGSQVSRNLFDPCNCKPYVSRVFRDEEKCSGKYGAGWKTYCDQVQRISIQGWRLNSKLKWNYNFRFLIGWYRAYSKTDCTKKLLLGMN